MKIWAIANQKGGVGKTTTAISLAGHLVTKGARVLVVDMDPQGSMTSYFGFDPDNMSQSIYSLFKITEFSYEKISPILIDTRVERLTLLPASTALATLDRQLGAQEGKGLVLKKSLMALEKHFDYVLIDCLPMLGILMVNALAACEYLLLPVQTEFLALKGLDRMMNTLNMITRSRKTPLLSIIIPTMYDRRTRASAECLDSLREKYAEKVWELVIPVDTQFREASQKGLPISIMNRTTHGSIAYEELLSFLLKPIQQNHLKLVG